MNKELHWTKETTEALKQYQLTHDRRLFEDILYPAFRGNAMSVLQNAGWKVSKQTHVKDVFDLRSEEMLSELVIFQYSKIDEVDCSNNPRSYLWKAARNRLSGLNSFNATIRRHFVEDQKYFAEDQKDSDLIPTLIIETKDTFYTEVFYAIKEHLELNAKLYFPEKVLTWVNEKLIPSFDSDVNLNQNVNSFAVTGRKFLKLGVVPGGGTSRNKLRKIVSETKRRVLDGEDTKTPIEELKLPKLRLSGISVDDVEKLRGSGLRSKDAAVMLNVATWRVEVAVRKYSGMTFGEFAAKTCGSLNNHPDDSCLTQ